MDRDRFGALPDGRAVERFTLTSGGTSVAVLTLGATIQSVRIPDAGGRVDEVALGCAGVDDYLAQRAYLGAVVGRYANRIAGASFELDGVVHRLAANEGGNVLHGGPDGFDRRLWSLRAVEDGPVPGIELELASADGDQGFPGALTARVRYRLTGSALRVDFWAQTDAPTVVNLTSHAYWNLAGSGTIDDHLLWLDARRYLPVGEGLIPTGELARVSDTPFDFFTQPETLGRRVDMPDSQLIVGEGYDHTFVLEDRARSDGPRVAASVFDPSSRRRLDVLTTAPGVQVYSGNRLDGTIVGSSGCAYGRRAGLALEPQLFPDSPNRRRFPSSVLRPGEQLRTTTVYRFGVGGSVPSGRG